MPEEEIQILREEKNKLTALMRQEGREVIFEEFALLPEETIVETSKLKDEIEKLKELVYKDELTKVLNRRGFLEKFNSLFTEAVYHKKNPGRERKFEVGSFSVLFLDGDNFKSVNDNYGHDEGDRVLKAIANVLKDSVRSADAVGRYGGEEFVVALLGANEEEAYNKAEEIRKKFPNVIKIEQNLEHLITASIGVASLDKSDADTLDELIAYADQAMYEAKSNRGKNNTVKFSELFK
jgi:diguanylate cyclase (GGDEF)-like protein